MVTLRDYAATEWTEEQERRRNSLLKKRKRKAKKIEEEIEDFLPNECVDYKLERFLEDPTFTTVVSYTDEAGTLRFTHDDDDDLVLIGACPSCGAEDLSVPVENAADLGRLLEAFETGSAHQCKTRRRAK